MQEKASKVDFCSVNCSRERTAQGLSEKRLHNRPRAAGSRNPRRSHEKTPGSQKPQHGHAKQGARQGGTEPGTTRFRDGRKTTRPPAPRWAPERPRLNCGRKAPAGKARKFSAWQILQILAILDLSGEADLAACGKRAEPKTKPREDPTHYRPTLKYILRS